MKRPITLTLTTVEAERLAQLLYGWSGRVETRLHARLAGAILDAIALTNADQRLRRKRK